MTAVPRRELATTTEWKIFMCNAYQIAPLFVNKFNHTCKDHAVRGERLGHLIQREAPDVVCLQEMWGGGQLALEKALSSSTATFPFCGSKEKVRGHEDNTSIKDRARASYRYTYITPKYMRSWYGWSVLDTVVQYATKRGGLWFSERSVVGDRGGKGGGGATHPIAYPRQHTFTISNTKSCKGVMASRHEPKPPSTTDRNATEVEVRGAKTGIRERNEKEATAAVASEPRSPPLLIFNTHLDPDNRNQSIEKQLREVLLFIRRVLTDEYMAYRRQGAVDGQTSAMQTDREGGGGDKEAFLPAAAVLLGDFNFTPISELYKSFLSDGEKENSAADQLQHEQKTVISDNGKGNPTKPAETRVREPIDYNAARNGVKVREALDAESLRIPTYDGATNPYVIWTEDTGRLDHFFVIESFDLLFSEEDVAGDLGVSFERERHGRVALLKGTVKKSRVLNSSECIVSDHYAVVVDYVVDHAHPSA